MERFFGEKNIKAILYKLSYYGVNNFKNLIKSLGMGANL